MSSSDDRTLWVPCSALEDNFSNTEQGIGRVQTWEEPEKNLKYKKIGQLSYNKLFSGSSQVLTLLVHCSVLEKISPNAEQGTRRSLSSEELIINL